MPWTEEEIEDLELRNIDNMLYFYAEELKQIANGAPAHSVIGRPLINRLKLLGIFEVNNSRGQRRRVTLSRKGRMILGLPVLQ